MVRSPPLTWEQLPRTVTVPKFNNIPPVAQLSSFMSDAEQKVTPEQAEANKAEGESLRISDQDKLRFVSSSAAHTYFRSQPRLRSIPSPSPSSSRRKRS